MRIFDLIGRALGAAAGAVVSILWMTGIWMPDSGMVLSGINFVVALLMALLALFAVIASVRGHGTVLIVLFVASFFPVGFVLLGADHWLRWAGWLNLCYLVAGLSIRLGRPRGDTATDTPA